MAGLREEQVRRVLGALNGDVLQWTPPFAGRTTEVVDPSRETCGLDFKELNRKREFDQNRLETMLEYGRSRECRQRFLTSYFGEDVGDWTCDICDHCSSHQRVIQREPTEEELRAIKIILRTVRSLDGRVGQGKVAMLLAGSTAEAIIETRLSRHPEYASLTHLEQTEIRRLLRALTSAGCLERVGDSQYPCVDITDIGERVLAGTHAVTLDFHEDGGSRSTGKVRSHRPRRESSPPAIGGGGTDDLFERLRQLRNDLANDKGVPAYRILTNAALEALAEARPVTQEEALDIKGIGPMKARTIIPGFLEEIAIWRAENC
jgi:ATP-dependent DNA helicase RecQ